MGSSKGGGSSAPAPVDPYEAAQAQYQYGAATANYNTELARPSVNTPYGSVDWESGANPGVAQQPINVPGYGSFGYVSPSAQVPMGGSGLPITNPSGQGAIPLGGGAYAPYSPPQVSVGGSGLPFENAAAAEPLGSGGGGSASSTVAPYSGAAVRPVQHDNLFEDLTTGGTSAFLNPSGPDTAGLPPGTPAVGANGQTTDPYALTAANTLTAPNWTENVSLSAPQQQLLNLQEGTQLSSGLTGQSLAGQTAENLNQPITSTPIQTSINTSGVAAIPGAADLAGFTNQAQEAAYQQQTQYLDPQFAQEQEQLDAQLRNQGAQPGDPAYNNAMQIFNNQKQQAYQSAENNSVQQGLTEQQALYGEGANTNQQQFGEAATQQSAANTGAAQQLAQELQVRDQPLNELSTEYGLSNPNGTTALQSATGGGAGSATAPDILSAFNTSAQQQEANYNAQVASANAQTSSEAGLASALLIALA
jgi:hypothetical protein